LKWMQGLTEALTGEGGTIQLQEPTNDTRVTPEAAQLEISAIRTNKDHPYNNKQDPSHEMAKKHVGDLYVKAYPNLREEGESHTQFGVG